MAHPAQFKGRNGNINHSIRGQSEVTGVVLMTAVVVILSVIVGGAILTNIDTQDEPVANLEVSVDASSVTVSHHGGTHFPSDEITVYFRSGNTEHHSLGTFQERQGDPDGNFAPGERVTRIHNATGVVTVFIVHDPSNTVLYDRAFDVPGSGLSPLTWGQATDWDASSTETNVVHDSFGDHNGDRIELGYPVTDSGLVGYWTLDGESGGAADASGTGNDGQADGGPTRGVGGILGTTAWEFDGSDDRITVANDTTLEMNDTDAVTVSMWVSKSTNQSGWIGLLQHSDTSYNLQFDNGNSPAFTIYDETWNTAYSGESLVPGRWYHLVGTFDGTQARIYVNGSVAGTASADFIAPGGDLPVGIAYNNDTGNRNFEGRMDAVRLYDRALSSDEVGALWNTSSEGTLTTADKTFSEPVDPTTLLLTDVNATIPSGTNVTVYVESDPEGDGTFNRSDEISLDGRAPTTSQACRTKASDTDFGSNWIQTRSRSHPPSVGRRYDRSDPLFDTSTVDEHTVDKIIRHLHVSQDES